jgi:response regulator NasT
MSNTYRIAIADDDADTLFCLGQLLKAVGHDIVVAASSGQEVVEECRSTTPDIIITDIMMASVDGIEAAGQILGDRDVPIIVVSGYLNDELLQRSNACGVFGYLIKPIRHADLSVAIEVAIRRHQEFRTLRDEASTLKQALEDRKTIERAKGILMKALQLDEAAAFHHLQEVARRHGDKMVSVAKSIILAEKTLGARSAVRSKANC